MFVSARCVLLRIQIHRVTNRLLPLQEWVALLREMALSFTTNPALSEYQSLVSTDPEVDFFYNIVHLQVAISFTFF